MRETTTENTAECLTHFVVGRLRIYVEQRLRRQDDAAETIPTLRGALLDERLLNGMRMFRSAEALERRDFRISGNTHRHHAGPNHLATHDHSAGSALCQTTAESWTIKPKLIIEHEQQGRVRFHCDGVLLTVDLQPNFLLASVWDFYFS